MDDHTEPPARDPSPFAFQEPPVSPFPVSDFRMAAIAAKVVPPVPSGSYMQPQDPYLNHCWLAAGARPCPGDGHRYETGYLNESDEGGGAWEGICVLCRKCGLMAPYTQFNGDDWYEEVAKAMTACPGAPRWHAGTKGGEPRVWFLTNEDPELLAAMGEPVEWRMPA